MSDNQRSDKIIEAERKYTELFGSPPTILVRAPGRVNLIGEHTDYNDGFVFPAAIEREVVMAGSVRTDNQVRIYALNFNQSSTFSLSEIQPAVEGRERWSNYIRAMAFILQSENIPIFGMNLVVLGDVPLGSGLSSSAAMLVAASLAFTASTNTTIDPVKRALLAQRAEREFVGVNVGIMDMFISALGQANHALLIDTHSLEFEAVPLPATGVSIVIADTNKKRGLVDSQYNSRRAECEEAVALLKKNLPDIRALRDVSMEDFEKYGPSLPEKVQKRARHVITEDARTLESVKALKRGDIARFGVLMNGSHDSLRDDYEVSCLELDYLVESARSVDGVYGSRMTGAGFGGCTVSLVAEDAVENFKEEVPDIYKTATGLNTKITVTTAAQGAERLL